MSFILKKNKKFKPVENISSGTIEQIHEEKIKYFNSLQKKLVNLKPGTMDAKDIKDIEDRVEENDYFLSIGHILLEYHSLGDDKNIIDIESMENNTITSEKQKVIEKYYDALDIPYKKNTKSTNNILCKYCHGEMSRGSESYMLCITCGFIDNDKIIDGLNFQERCEISQVFVFDYKRINYFTEWLTQIQANEITDIPKELIESLKSELFKRNIKDTSKLTNIKLKKILKETNNSKYYEHIPLIISKLCNSKPLVIPDDICTELKNMFITIQEPFEKLKKDRRNFLSYPYVLYKFCEILNLHEYLVHFSLLKSREKLMKTDSLWKSMLEEIRRTTGDNRWVFIPSC